MVHIDRVQLRLVKTRAMATAMFPSLIKIQLLITGFDEFAGDTYV